MFKKVQKFRNSSSERIDTRYKIQGLEKKLEESLEEIGLFLRRFLEVVSGSGSWSSRGFEKK